LLSIAVAAALAFLGLAPTVEAVALPAPAAAVAQPYGYDGQHRGALPTDTTAERGPPAVAYDYTEPYLGVAPASHGPLACPACASTLAYTTYDHAARSVQFDTGAANTRTAPGGRTMEVRFIP